MGLRFGRTGHHGLAPVARIRTPYGLKNHVKPEPSEVFYKVGRESFSWAGAARRAGFLFLLGFLLQRSCGIKPHVESAEGGPTWGQRGIGVFYLEEVAPVFNTPKPQLLWSRGPITDANPT